MNPMMLLQMVFGGRYQEMLNKWNSMSPEQKQAEMNKISGMSNEQKRQILSNFGIDPNLINQFQNQMPQQTNEQKFNY